MRNWTEEQTSAITTRNKTILLSAAAGSGKTAVLTERTIRAIIDDENPLDITRLLAVTFTRAAARELRDRIGAALAERVRQNPHDARLARQLRLLPTAKICTIDSFCGDLVRRFATRAGVSDGYRVADQQETDLARISLMEGLIEDAYAGRVPDLSADNFASLVTRLYAVREESGVGETLLSLIERMETLTDGVDTLAQFSAAYRQDAALPLMQTQWGEEIRRFCAHVGNYYLSAFDKAHREACLDSAMEQKCEEYFAVLRSMMQTLADPHVTYSALAALPSCPIPRSPNGLGTAAPHLKALIDEFRDKYVKRDASAKVTKLVSYTEEQWRDLLIDLADYTDMLHKLAREFVLRESRESRRRGVYSFAQIERLAYSLLIEGGARTPLAEALSEEYDAVSVDEYQDVSPLQHAVFEAIARERTRFLVGDIKQSIYRFRHADPTIFAKLRAAFPTPDTAGEGPDVALFMSKNFRCDGPVIDYVNHVFNTLFAPHVAGESIGYTPADALRLGKDAEGTTMLVKPVLAVFESAAGGLAAVSDGATLTGGLPDAAHVAGGEQNRVPDPDSDYFEEEDDEASVHAEAMWVASTIRDLVDHGTLNDGATPISPSDIAVLLRSKRGKVLPYIEALHAYGIPAETPEATDFFSCPEVLLTLSMLRTIDNPRRDIPLAAVLLSPLYRFSADDLTLIRRASPDGIPLYDALTAYCCANPGFERGHTFLSQLASFRDAAENTSVDRLLRRVMSETPLMAIAGADGKGGDAKVRLLYHYALRRSGGEEGLYSFIHYINRQIETGKTFTPPATVGETAGVTVMTVHSSKGLEFPVVFLADCGKQFSRLDCLDHFVYDGAHPLAFRLRDRSGLVRVENPVRHIVCNTLTEDNAEEEMRLLYVALTRARERLYMSGTLPAKKTIEDALDAARREADDVSRFSVMRRNSYLSLLLLCQEKDPSFADLLLSPTPAEPPTLAHAEKEEATIDSAEVARVAAAYRADFAYTYPRLYMTHIPGKLSVSRLTPTLLDGTESETTHLETLATHNPASLTAPPAFEEPTTETSLSADDTHEKYRRMPEAWAGVREADPTERGIASHKFMQFCDFNHLAERGVEAEMERLIDRGFLSRADAGLVRVRELEKFRASTLLTLMREAQEVKREFRFHVRLPAAHFTSDPALADRLGDEMLLVQGVMDAVIIDRKGAIALVDYKTDRLTREELADPTLAAEKMHTRHAAQLRYYATAIREIFGRAPDRVSIYSLQLGECIDLRLD